MENQASSHLHPPQEISATASVILKPRHNDKLDAQPANTTMVEVNLPCHDTIAQWNQIEQGLNQVFQTKKLSKKDYMKTYG